MSANVSTALILTGPWPVCISKAAFEITIAEETMGKMEKVVI